MKIRILSLIKLREPALKPLEEDYRKRLSRFFPVELIDIKRESLKSGGAFSREWEQVKEKTGKSFLILLDEKGKGFDSQSLAAQWGRWLQGGRDLTFVIGGPEGFPENMKQEADMLMSLSPLTFPHKLVRLLLLEALYRANDILQGGPYHRE
jgi:23S rRNA (pseudouridine1915-N3)-methyltransferase